mmetsp:Transcript_9281/g.30338  ORF Transcript_9281/g.30338 Transcript_9281/m.30338 type:complete len:306 (+) Transcript_9281:41-958(+)
MSAGEPPPVCPVVKDFLARQGIIAFAGLVFLGWTWVRVRRGLETRDVRTFAADTSKQAGQQAMGGAMMVVLGHKLAEDGFSPLAWYGALYPFEIVLTTGFTGVFRRLNEALALHISTEKPWLSWAQPLANVGQYGPGGRSDFRCSWYAAQLLQATLLIGLPARLCALGLVSASLLLLPSPLSPCHQLARAYFLSGWPCGVQAAAILYACPLLGDAVQFIVIDRLQAARGPAPGRRSLGSSRPSVMARVSHVLAPFSARRFSDGSPHDDELGRRILLTPSQPTSHDPSPDGSRAAAAAGPPDHRLP